MWVERSPYILLMGMQTSVAIMEINMRVLKKLKIAPPNNPAISLLGILPEELCTGYFPVAKATYRRTNLFGLMVPEVGKYGRNTCMADRARN